MKPRGNTTNRHIVKGSMGSWYGVMVWGLGMGSWYGILVFRCVVSLFIKEIIHFICVMIMELKKIHPIQAQMEMCQVLCKNECSTAIVLVFAFAMNNKLTVHILI